MLQSRPWKSHENRKNRRKSKEENVLHTYDDEDNSINENAASWEIAGAEITLCVSCSLIFQKETVFLGSCPVGAFWEAPERKEEDSKYSYKICSHLHHSERNNFLAIILLATFWSNNLLPFKSYRAV